MNRLTSWEYRSHLAVETPSVGGKIKTFMAENTSPPSAGAEMYYKATRRHQK